MSIHHLIESILFFVIFSHKCLYHFLFNLFSSSTCSIPSPPTTDVHWFITLYLILFTIIIIVGRSLFPHLSPLLFLPSGQCHICIILVVRLPSYFVIPPLEMRDLILSYFVIPPLELRDKDLTDFDICNSICPPSLCTNISIHHHTASKHTQSARVACLLLLHSLLLTYIITIVPWMYKTSACACRHLSSTHLSKVYWNFRHSRRVYHVYCSLLCICPRR